MDFDQRENHSLGAPKSNFPLSAIFKSNCAEPVRTMVEEIAEEVLEPCLADLVARGRKRWPTFPTTPEEFVSYLAERLNPTPSLIEALNNLNVEDLYLACTCLQGFAPAILELEQILQKTARQVGASKDLSMDGCSDLLQKTREFLLVSTDGKSSPRLAQYAGRGSLGGWVRVVLAREKVRFAKTRRKQADLSTALDEAIFAEQGDPELAALRGENLAIFRGAIRVVIEKLSEEEKLLLRHWILDSMTMEQIARVFGITRKTASRWIHKLRRRMLMLIKFELTRSLKLRQSELNSLIRDVESKVDVSLSGLLPPSNKPEKPA